jgi:putative membrane protein insertion efficiency factor
MKSYIARAMCVTVRGYQLLLGPVLPPSCRFYPSCSNYAIDALRRHGPVSGLWLAVRRILRCHPWGGQGVDPVPEELRSPLSIVTHFRPKSRNIS